LAVADKIIVAGVLIYCRDDEVTKIP
jgi:hypothetical protein